MPFKGPGPGRPKGVPNKATVELKALAQKYTKEALIELVRLAGHAENEAVRVSAIKELFDRAYGKAPQAITGADGEAIKHEHTFDHFGTVIEILAEAARARGNGLGSQDGMDLQSQAPAGHA